MRRLLTLSLVILTSVLTVGCDDDVTGVDRFGLDEFEGGLNATRFEFINNANPDQSVELISEGGSFSLQIDPQGRFFETSFNPRTGVTETRTGTAQVRGSDLVLDGDAEGDTRVFAITRSRNGFTLSRANDRFDFDNDGVLDSATFETDLRRTR
jgi:hypothetical protein